MKLSRETLDMIVNVNEMYKDLDEAIGKLNRSIKKDTEGNLTLASPFHGNLSLHLVNLADKHSLIIMTELADGEVKIKWVDNDTTCYGFSIEGTECIMLVREEEDGKEVSG